MKELLASSIAARLMMPIAACIIAVAVILGWFTASMLRGNAEHEAAVQMSGTLQSVHEMLEVVNDLSLEKVHASMNLLIRESTALGHPSAGQPVLVGPETVPNLRFGRSGQANRFTLVDEVTRVGGGTATVFSRREDDFVRVTTNVRKPDGSRAVGTLLDPRGKAIVAVREGRSYYGIVDILGAPYMTGYEPITSERREVIGILYAGYPLTSLSRLSGLIEATHVQRDGFVAIVDGRGKVRMHTRDIADSTIVRVLADTIRSGWEVQRSAFDPWGYSIVAAYPTAELTAKVEGTILAVAGIAVAVAALLVVVVLAFTRRLIARPLQQLCDQMDRADLSTSLSEIRTDEVGRLTGSFNHFVAKVRSTLLDVEGSAEAVGSASAEISSSSQQLAAGAHEQTVQTGEVAETVERMAKSIVDNSTNASAAADTAQAARASAEQGGRIVSDTVTGMRRIAEVVNRSAETVRLLGDSSMQIGEIISVINDIADQTNLLALNAAIEAARAGDQGRGFAVVADEVRKLAERTTKATHEIEGMIRKIQEDTRGAADVMTTGTSEVAAGIASADKAGRALQEIVEISQRLTDMVACIAVASKEQSEASDFVLKNVHGIDSVTQQTASATRQLARAAEDLNRLTESLGQIVGTFQLHEEGMGRNEVRPAAPIEKKARRSALRAARVAE